jgi:hypothetical protein
MSLLYKDDFHQALEIIEKCKLEESKEENKANLDEAVKKICDQQRAVVEQLDNNLNGLNINYLEIKRYITRIIT